MTKILESLKTLGHLSTQIEHNVQVAKLALINKIDLDYLRMEGFYSNIPFSGSIKSISFGMIQLMSNSYLDELQTQLTPKNHPEYARQIIGYQNAIKPALNRIKEWKHLKEFRNQFLAHNYRHKGDSIFSNNHTAKEFKTPYSDSDFFLLAELISLMNKQHFIFFPSEVNRLIKDGDKIMDKYICNVKSIDFREEISVIESLVLKNIEDYKMFN